MHYIANPITTHSRTFTRERWMAASVNIFLYFISGLWNQQYDALYGVSGDDEKAKRKKAVVGKVKK